MGYTKYTKEILEPLVKQSVSILSIVKKLGMPQTTSNHRHIKSRIVALGLDISHFLGVRSNSGNDHKGGFERLTHENILVLDRFNGRRESSQRLKRTMIEIGIEEKCEYCSIGPVWNNQKLTLQVDHKNGNGLDNRKENLRFLCPNCHSQTHNFGHKNRKN